MADRNSRMNIVDNDNYEDTCSHVNNNRVLLYGHVDIADYSVGRGAVRVDVGVVILLEDTYADAVLHDPALGILSLKKPR